MVLVSQSPPQWTWNPRKFGHLTISRLLWSTWFSAHENGIDYRLINSSDFTNHKHFYVHNAERYRVWCISNEQCYVLDFVSAHLVYDVSRKQGRRVTAVPIGCDVFQRDKSTSIWTLIKHLDFLFTTSTHPSNNSWYSNHSGTKSMSMIHLINDHLHWHFIFWLWIINVIEQRLSLNTGASWITEKKINWRQQWISLTRINLFHFWSSQFSQLQVLPSVTSKDDVIWYVK